MREKERNTEVKRKEKQRSEVGEATGSTSGQATKNERRRRVREGGATEEREERGKPAEDFASVAEN